MTQQKQSPAENSASQIRKSPLSLQLNADDFLPATEEEKLNLIVMRESVSFWRDSLRRLGKNKVAMVSLFFILLIIFFSFVVPNFYPYSYSGQQKGAENLRPLTYSASEMERMAAGEAGPDTPDGYPQEKIDDAASSLYGNIGNLYYEIDSLPQAMSYYAKAGEIFKKYDWKISSSILEHNMGDIWAHEGNDAKAVECYNTAISYAQEADDSLWMASPKLGLGALFMRQGKVTKALKYLHEADEYYSKHQDQEYYDRIATLDIMGQAYQTQKRQRSMLATAFAVLALVLLSLLIITRRALRLKRENVAADEAIGEALTQLEMTDSLFRLKMDQNVQLSRGEQEILPMIAEGLTSKDIAKRLFVTEQTIKWRRQRLLAKFDARNTAEMLSKAREIGLL